MKRTHTLLLITLLSAMTLASCKKDPKEDPVYSYISCETGAVSEITPISAKLSGIVTVRNFAGSRMLGYFYYADQPMDRSEIRANGKKTKLDTLAVRDTTFRLVVEGLKPNTTYYYAAGLGIDGLALLDDVASFTTPDFCLTQAATDVTATSATLNAAAYLSAEQKPGYDYGFEYTKIDFDDANERITVMAAAPGEDNLFKVTLTGLTPNTKYYFRAFTRKDAFRNHAESLSFTTAE